MLYNRNRHGRQTLNAWFLPAVMHYTFGLNHYPFVGVVMLHASMMPTTGCPLLSHLSVMYIFGFMDTTLASLLY